MTVLPVQKITPVILLSMFLGACGDVITGGEEVSEPVARPAKIVSLMQTTASLKRTYPGTLEASQKADLAFRVNGQLIDLPAQAGLHVEAGDLLARIDPSNYENTVAERQARYDLAKTQLAQASELLKKNLSSQINYEQANAELKSAGAALQQARDNLNYTSLSAPFSGVVARVSIENYQPVQVQIPIIQLRRDEELNIRFSVPETLLAQLKRVEDPAVLSDFCGEVKFNKSPTQSYRACHKEHETVADPLTRNYSALFRLEKINDFVALPGMTASIELDFTPYLASGMDQSVYAPVEAVFSEDGNNWVWLVDEKMKARKTKVTVGRIEGNHVQVKNSVDPSSRIIAAGVSYVREGMLVKQLIKQRGL